MRVMKFNIMNQTWCAKRVEAHDPGLYVDGTPRVGSTWSVHQTIYISDELSDDYAKRVILHELTHAFISATQAETGETWTEEGICEFISIYNSAIFVLAHEIYSSLFLVDLDTVGDTVSITPWGGEDINAKSHSGV